MAAVWRAAAPRLSCSRPAAARSGSRRRGYPAALPPPLREYAGIEDEVVVAGVNIYLELWDKGQWEAEKAVSQEQAWQIIESLEQHG